MILTKKINICINVANIKHFEKLDYHNLKLKQKISIPVEHLMRGSNVRIKVKCDECGKEKEITNFSYTRNIKKYGIYACSVKCSYDSGKIKKTKLDRYGDENYTNREKFKETVNNKTDKEKNEIKLKVKKTKKERYGDENYHNIKQMKETNLEKYGFEFASQLEEIKEKAKNTKKERYGDENYNNIEKNKKTVKEKYGVENVFQLEEIKEKSKQTNLKNLGVEHNMQNEKVKNKANKTNLEKYGVKWTTQSENMKNKSRKTYLERYGDENYRNQEKRKQTCLIKYGVENPQQREESKRKYRLKRIKDIEEKKLNGNQLCPNYSKNSIPILESKAKELGITDLQHGENGGEYYIKELGYWVDGFSKEKNIVIEYDEKQHYSNGALKKKDIGRQKEIEEFLGCKFIRIKE